MYAAVFTLRLGKKREFDGARTAHQIVRIRKVSHQSLFFCFLYFYSFVRSTLFLSLMFVFKSLWESKPSLELTGSHHKAFEKIFPDIHVLVWRKVSEEKTMNNVIGAEIRAAPAPGCPSVLQCLSSKHAVTDRGRRCDGHG